MRHALPFSTPWVLATPLLAGAAAGQTAMGGTLAYSEPPPRFELESTSGETLSSEALRGRPFVLVFFSSVGVRGFTEEARPYVEREAQLRYLGVPILGVLGTHRAAASALRASARFPFPLLADPEGELCRRTGALRSGVLRQLTYLFDPAGSMIALGRRDTSEEQLDEVLRAFSWRYGRGLTRASAGEGRSPLWYGFEGDRFVVVLVATENMARETAAGAAPRLRSVTLEDATRGERRTFECGGATVLECPLSELEPTGAEVVWSDDAGTHRQDFRVDGLDATAIYLGEAIVPYEPYVLRARFWEDRGTPTVTVALSNGESEPAFVGARTDGCNWGSVGSLKYRDDEIDPPWLTGRVGCSLDFRAARRATPWEVERWRLDPGVARRSVHRITPRPTRDGVDVPLGELLRGDRSTVFTAWRFRSGVTAPELEAPTSLPVDWGRIRLEFEWSEPDDCRVEPYSNSQR